MAVHPRILLFEVFGAADFDADDKVAGVRSPRDGTTDFAVGGKSSGFDWSKRVSSGKGGWLGASAFFAAAGVEDFAGGRTTGVVASSEALLAPTAAASSSPFRRSFIGWTPGKR